MSYVAVIPARGGSKGIKNKNLQLVGEHSLVARAVMAARETQRIDRIIVSTDSEEIAKEAINCGAEVHKRSEKTANDIAKTIDAVKELAMDFGLDDEVCVLLQPTSPLRKAEDIVRALTEYEAACKTGSVVTVAPCDHHPYKMVVRTESGFSPVTTLSDLEEPRQRLPEAFRINGAVYVIGFTELFANMSFFAKPQHFVEMNEVASIDIDTQEDLQRANQLAESL